MRRLLISIVLISFIIGGNSCAGKKSGCPTYDKKTGTYKVKSGGKTKSGLFPKNMK